MSEKLTTRQKIIGGVILGIVIVILVIVGFFISQEESETVLDMNQFVEQKENIIAENKEKEEKSKITIHMIGEVKNTGILTLEEGARISDAIEQAGGATKEADLNEINLAYELQDGEQIYVPNKKDKEKSTQEEYITKESGNNVVKGKNESSTNKKGGGRKVNINEASQSELETLPGIGPSIANRIIEYRTQNGKFEKIEDLQNVKGIGDSKFANVKDNITIK